MTKLYRYLTVLMAICGFVGVATPAQAVNTTYAFSGQCLDCGANNSATGLLTLSDYTLGDAIDMSNFVSFSYSSANFSSFMFDTINQIAGAITGDGANNVALQGTSGGQDYYFGTASNGSWTLVQLFPADVGVQGSWTAVQSAVPEPAAWALMIVGFGVAGLALRRRKVAVVAA